MLPSRAISAISTRLAPPNSAWCLTKVCMYSCLSGSCFVNEASMRRPRTTKNSIATVTSTKVAITSPRRAKIRCSIRAENGLAAHGAAPGAGSSMRRAPSSPTDDQRAVARGAARRRSPCDPPAARASSRRRRRATPAPCPRARPARAAAVAQHDAVGEHRRGAAIRACASGCRRHRSGTGCRAGRRPAGVAGQRQHAEERAGIRRGQRPPARPAVVGAVQLARFRGDVEALALPGDPVQVVFGRDVVVGPGRLRAGRRRRLERRAHPGRAAIRR